MPAYIRQIKRKKGGVSVQIEYRDNTGKRINLKHIGTAHSEMELKLLKML